MQIYTTLLKSNQNFFLRKIPFSRYIPISLLSNIQVSTSCYSWGFFFIIHADPNHRPLECADNDVFIEYDRCWASAPCLLCKSVPRSWPLDVPRIPGNISYLFLSVSLRMGLHPQQDMRMNKAVWISYWVRLSLPFYHRAQSQLEEQNFKYYSSLVLSQNIPELKQNKRICFNRIHFFQSLVLTFFLNVKSINISKFWKILMGTLKNDSHCLTFKIRI